MHVFLTGGTGFVGSYILKALLDHGHTVRCLVRPGSEEKLDIRDDRVEVTHGNITDDTPVDMAGCDAVVHLVGIIEERRGKGITFEAVHDHGTRFVVDQAKAAGIDRFIHMSANGAKPDGISAYQTSKWQAEQHVQQAGFAHWTIFRPSLIFGDPGPDRPEFAVQLAGTLIKPFPVLPVFGDGQYGMQPIAVEVLAEAFVQALTLEAANGQIYFAGGREAYPYIEILDRITAGLGLGSKPKLRQPIWMVRPIVHTLGRIGLLPISPDQFEMLIAGNTGDAEPFFRDFDLADVPFDAGYLTYVRAY